MPLLFAILRERTYVDTRDPDASLQLDPLLNFEILWSAKSKPPRKISVRRWKIGQDKKTHPWIGQETRHQRDKM